METTENEKVDAKVDEKITVKEVQKEKNSEVFNPTGIDTRAILRVKSSTNVKSLAGSITATMKDYGVASLRCIGDGAIGRAVRAAAIASGHLKPAGIDIVLQPYFYETVIDGQEKTAVAINVEVG